MSINRRQFTAAFGAAALAASAPGRLLAQSWPTRSVNCVVGYAPGGGVDAVMRTIAPHLSARLGQQFLVENKPGASAILAASHVAKSTPDGYTLFGTDGGALALNGALFSKLPYDAVRDFAPVSLVIRAPLLIVATPSFPASDLRGLIEIANREKGKVAYASPGSGTYHHLAMELLKRRANFAAQDVPYKGAGQAVQDVIAGQVPIMPLDTIVGLPQIRAGKLKVLAALTPKRLDYLRDVPTAAEQGFADVIVYPWVGIAAPRATPKDVVARLGSEIRQVVAMPEVSKRFTDLGMEPYSTTPEEFATFVDSEINRWHPLIKSLNIRLD
jgi:tripartite-type tricarboxylate transporter receptor subunit TctC